MEQKLLEYGIQTEKSFQRAHVCYLAGKIYTYKTICGVDAVNSGKYPSRYASQPGVGGAFTAKGYCVPPGQIEGCRMVPIPRPLMSRYPITQEQSTSKKGSQAVAIVQALMRNGLFPFFVSPIEVFDHKMQVSGTDIYVEGSFCVQVKCDLRGGEGVGCTGNLYLQTHECNPLGLF